jgi:low affinity Fe/Cu permease
MAQPQRSKPRKAQEEPSLSDRFRAWSDAITRAVGTPWAMVAALAIVVVWFVTGPIFGFSDTWQLVINTGTTIVTFLMVFAIQTSQNRESTALHLKIDELIRAHPSARNRLMGEELATEAEVEEDERDMMERADHEDAETRHRRAEASRRRKQTQRDRR